MQLAIHLDMGYKRAIAALDSGIPKKTSAQTTWACKVWADWVLYRTTSIPLVDNEKKYTLVL